MKLEECILNDSRRRDVICFLLEVKVAKKGSFGFLI